MKKIPTIFVRDWEGILGPPGRMVIDAPHDDCGWVFAGEGIPTRKFDGTCCLVRTSMIYRRYEVKVNKKTGKLRGIPEGFEPIETDEKTGEIVGWVPVGEGPEDKWHRLAFDNDETMLDGFPDGTYELIGKQFNGNPEGWGDDQPYLVAHGYPLTDEDEPLGDVPTTYEGLRSWLIGRDIEGVVWHNPDGRMAKIKGRDFGIPRP